MTSARSGGHLINTTENNSEQMNAGILVQKLGNRAPSAGCTAGAFVQQQFSNSLLSTTARQRSACLHLSEAVSGPTSPQLLSLPWTTSPDLPLSPHPCACSPLLLLRAQACVGT